MTRLGLAVLVLAGTSLILDRLFPLNLSRLATTGTEVLDRQGKTVALLPAPGGIWRFRASADDVAPILLHTLVTTEDRHFWHHPGVNPISLLRASRSGPARGPDRLRRLHAHHAGRAPAGTTAQNRPIETDRDRAGVAAGVAFFQARNPRHLAHLGADTAATSKGFGPGPWRGSALRPQPRRGAGGACWWASRDGRRHFGRIAIPRRRAPSGTVFWRGGRRGMFPAPAANATPCTTGGRGACRAARRSPRHSICHCSSRSSGWPPTNCGDCRSGPRSPCWWSMRHAGNSRDRFRRRTAGRGRAGALDLTRAVRSPGSAMKPFIYAMAFEDGIAGPETRVEDLPRHFGAYAPEDFDRGFAGDVTAGEALRRSLNLPAVELLDQVGPAQFAARLKAGRGFIAFAGGRRRHRCRWPWAAPGSRCAT